jgi:predicted nucleic acid-binding protein
VGSKSGLVLIDTNIFVIDLRYRRDIHYDNNLAFLNGVAEKGVGFTTIVNLLELCGILSFNLNEKQLLELWCYFQDKYKVTVLPTPELSSNFPTIGIQELFDVLKNRASLGDALMLTVAEKYLPFVSALVTWDDELFKGQFPGTVLTPEEYISPSSSGLE